MASSTGAGPPAAPAGRRLAAIECTVEHELPGGDHEIVVGRVRLVQTAEDDTAPLLYWRGSYAALGADPDLTEWEATASARRWARRCLDPGARDE